MLLLFCLIFTSYACSPAFVAVTLIGKSLVGIWINLKEHRSPKRNIQIYVKVLFGTFEYSDYVYCALEVVVHQWLSRIMKRIVTAFMFK